MSKLNTFDAKSRTWAKAMEFLLDFLWFCYEIALSHHIDDHSFEVNTATEKMLPKIDLYESLDLNPIDDEPYSSNVH